LFKVDDKLTGVIFKISLDINMTNQWSWM